VIGSWKQEPFLFVSKIQSKVAANSIF